MRAEDAAECRAGGMEPTEALRTSIEQSQEAYVFGYKGDLLCVFGFQPSTFMGETAHAWMLSTEHAAKHWYKFARTSFRTMHWLLERFPKIEVSVHEDYHLAVEWLGWLGFTINETKDNFHIMVRVR